MSVADDIVCDALPAVLRASTRSRGFMKPCTKIVTGGELIAAFGDNRTALLMYNTETVLCNKPLGPMPSY